MPGLKPDSDKMIHILSSQELLDAADTCKVLWAKVKGHPYWPVSPVEDALLRERVPAPSIFAVYEYPQNHPPA
jgi:hypothetical protein